MKELSGKRKEMTKFGFRQKTTTKKQSVYRLRKTCVLSTCV